MTPPNKNSDGALPPVVATVNGQEISTKLYEMYLKNGKEALALDPNTDEGRKKVDQLREGIVSELIDRALIGQEAQRRGLTISPDKLAQPNSARFNSLVASKSMTNT